MTTYQVGDELTSPRGGMPVIVAGTDTDGSTIATEDGGMYEGAWCRCADPGDDVAYYEYLDGAGRGLHGWFHTACRRITQTG